MTPLLTPKRQGETNPVFVIATNAAEARKIADAGFGFSSRLDGEKVLAEHSRGWNRWKIDTSPLRVFKVVSVSKPLTSIGEK